MRPLDLPSRTASSRSLNILLSAYSCEPYRGTEPGHGWNWALELARLGHNVFVITRPVGRQNIETFLAQSPCPTLHFIYVDSLHLSLRFGALRPIIECIWWQRQVLPVAKKLAAEVDLDIVHHVTWGSLHVGSHLWRLGKPFVFGPIGGGQVAESGFGRYLKGGSLLESLRTLVVRHFTGLLFSARSTVSHSDLVLVTNSETGEWARRLGATRVEFMLDVGMPRSMLSDERRQVKPAGTLKVLWVGRLLPRKAILLGLEALARIDKRLAISCTILGDGPQGRYLADWIRQLGLGERVTWRGQVGWDEVLQAFSEHDVFLFTSLRDSCGAQLIEAMARGVPIVTLDHHGAHVAVPAEAGVKVPVTTPEQTCSEVSRALERLANEPELVTRMGKAGRQCAEEHTWDRKIARAARMYPSLLSALPRPGVAPPPTEYGLR
jgi:glycosyltransferase involved in cell wall biosynthesis